MMTKRAGFAAGILLSVLVLGLGLPACAPAAPPPGSPTIIPNPTPRTAGSSAAPVATPTLVPAATPNAAPALSEKPRYGGILAVSLRDDPPSFDAQQDPTATIQNTMAPMYSLLVQNDPIDETKLIADLAEGWETSPDGKVYTFHLRKGVKFHDGTPLTSADIKATFEKIASPPKGVPSHKKNSFTALSAIETPDESTVKFLLKYPQGSFLQILALPFNFIYPKPLLDKTGSSMKKDIMGTGPFLFKEYVRGISFEVGRNPSYFVGDRPYLDGIKRYIIRDYAAVNAAFRTGQIRLVYGANHGFTPPDREILLRGNTGIVVEAKADSVAFELTMNHKLKPWNDVRVRKAASLVLDQQTFVDLVYQGDAEIGGYLFPGYWGLPKEELIKTPPYRRPTDKDITDAKRLLTEAGYPEGFKVTMKSRNWDDYVKMSVIAQGALAKIGIDATLRPIESGVWAAARVAHDFEVMGAGTATASLQEPDELLPTTYGTGGAANFGQYSNPKVDDLLVKQSRSMDPVERKKLINALERVLLDDVPSVPFFWRKYVALYWPEVRNFHWQSSIWLSQKFQDVWLAK